MTRYSTIKQQMFTALNAALSHATKYGVRRFLLRLTIAIPLLSASAHASENNQAIKFSYWNQASEPFVFLKEGRISGGILKELGDAIGKILNRPVEYRQLPVLRIEQFLQDGSVDADCITSPIWKEKPELYHWSPILFPGADRFLMRKEDIIQINEFSDLKGLHLGIYQGYVYHPTIMKMIKSGDIETHKIANIEKGIELLRLNRIDTFVDFGILIKYQLLSKKLDDELILAMKDADNFELSCALSKKSSIDPSDFNKAIKQLKESGQIDRSLNKYQ